MAHMGGGYGSEFHLLRFLGRHRKCLDTRVKNATGAQSVDWLDCLFKPKPNPPSWDSEWERLDFLPESSVARKKWKNFWPKGGKQHSWDAVGRILVEDRWEWLLVEAKSHLGEVETSCKAKEEGGRPKIRKALNQTKWALGIPACADWLNGYYQHANRIAALNFMMQNGELGRLLFVYFCGDKFPENSTVKCPENEEGWSKTFTEQDDHLGLSKGHTLAGRVHKIFVPVTNVDPV